MLNSRFCVIELIQKKPKKLHFSTLNGGKKVLFILFYSLLLQWKKRVIRLQQVGSATGSRLEGVPCYWEAHCPESQPPCSSYTRRRLCSALVVRHDFAKSDVFDCRQSCAPDLGPNVERLQSLLLRSDHSS